MIVLKERAAKRESYPRLSTWQSGPVPAGQPPGHHVAQSGGVSQVQLRAEQVHVAEHLIEDKDLALQNLAVRRVDRLKDLVGGGRYAVDGEVDQVPGHVDAEAVLVPLGDVDVRLARKGVGIAVHNCIEYTHTRYNVLNFSQ
jgi:hypothetical protein